MRPADTTRVSAAQSIRKPIVPLTTVPSKRKEEPPIHNPSSDLGQADGDLRKIRPLRLVLAQTAVSFTDEFLSNLVQLGIDPYITDPDNILRRLNTSPEEWEIIGYPIASQWQRALEFAREVRRVRERNGAMPYPWTFIIAFQEQFRTTVEWFRRVGGTRYWRFTSEGDFIEVLRTIRGEILESLRRCHKLHLRLVHSGNRVGAGCIVGETLEAVYVSFRPGIVDELEESSSILRFANLMGMYRWRARTAAQFTRLTQSSPFYSSQGLNSNVLGQSCIKTYIMRLEKALLTIWRKQHGDELPPPFIGHESRGGREVAYRLLGTAEIDHV